MEIVGLASTPQNKNVIYLEAGTWTITHEFKRPGSTSVWERGNGDKTSETFLRFSDGNNKDFNDIHIRFYYSYNPTKQGTLLITPIKGEPDLTYKPQTKS